MSKEVKTVGGLLLAARLARGVSLESIAKDICVRSTYLAAIEANDFKELPEKTFAVGFVRSYAAALGLNEDKIVGLFKEEFGDAPKEPVLSSEVVLAPRQRMIPAWLSPMVGVAGVALCWVMFGGAVVPFSMTASSGAIDPLTDEAQLQAVQATLPQSNQNYASATATNVDDQTTTIPGEEDAAPYVDAATFFSQPANANQPSVSLNDADITLRAREDAWVRLSNLDGTEIWSGVLREGQSYRPQLEGVALLSTSNAGGVSVEVGGDEIAALGTRGEVIEGFRLEASRQLSSLAGADKATGSR